MIRIIADFLFVVLFLIISLPIMLIELIIGMFSVRARDRSSLAVVSAAFRIVEVIAGVRLTIKGKENLPPKNEAVLYVANHRSFFDVVILYNRMRNTTGFVAKKELERIPVLGWWMKFLHCKFLDRKDIKQGLQTILSCIDDVKNGISIFIFPEGTRGKGKDELEVAPFKEGSMKVAVKGGVKIVPIAISHSSAIFEDHFPWLKSTHVTVEYGKPIDPSAYSKDEQKRIGEITREQIISMLKANEEG